MPTICSETCTGRIRYLGVMFYDADRVKDAASVENEQDLYQSQLDIFLDPHDPAVIAEAKKQGIHEDMIQAAQKSPIYKMIIEWKIALPLHPEYRTLPMVWYVPPLSPIMNIFEGQGSQAQPENIFPAIEQMRIPIQYLANLLTAGDEKTIRSTLKKMAYMRTFMRAKVTNKEIDTTILDEIGMNEKQMEEMYRLLAIAKYNDRFVIPASHREEVSELYSEQGSCGLAFAGGPGSCGTL